MWFWCSSRFSLIIIGFFGCMNLFSLRVNMSVAIVCMTEDRADVNFNSSNMESVNISQKSQENITGREISEVWSLLNICQSLLYLMLCSMVIINGIFNVRIEKIETNIRLKYGMVCKSTFYHFYYIIICIVICFIYSNMSTVYFYR